MRLVHQLSLLLAASALTAVAAVAGLVAWNLRAGFSDYLAAQDGEQLTRVMEIAERDLAQLGGAPQDWPHALRSWLEASRPRDARGPRDAIPDDPPEMAPRRPPRPATRPADRRPPPPRLDAAGPGVPRPRDPPPRSGAPPGPPPAPRRDPADLGPRMALLGADGTTLLAGHPRSLDRPGQTRAVKLHGQTLAVLRLAERAGPAQGVDASFLRRQYLGLAVVAGGVLAVALVLARWLAVRWARPLRAAQAAARRVAAGEFTVRLPARAGTSEIAELHADINAMAEALSRLESSRQRWIAELSHELRTPLAVLRGEIEALVDGIRALDRDALASLQDEVKRLSRLAEDFHLLATSELRALPSAFEAVAPAALLTGTVARFTSRARSRGLTLETQLPAGLPTAHWDAVRVTQLLGNLLENSLRYTKPPGCVRVQARTLGPAIEIRVDDTPPGVPETELERLFDPLYRVDVSRSRAFGGSGLGLAIARAIAQAHGGRLHAEPSPLGGLALVLTLPLQPAGACA